MEALGFFDTPSTNTSGSHTPLPSSTTVLTTTMEPTGNTVEDLWASTEVDSKTLQDWKPRPTSRGLHTRGPRLSPILIAATLILGLAAGSFWLIQSPGRSAEAAVITVANSATELSQGLTDLASYPEDLTAGALDRDSSPSALTLPVNEAARSLFSASAELPASEGETRSTASDAATLALDASRNLTDLTAFYMALDPILMAPPMETDSSLVDFEAAVHDFGNWRASLETVSVALPVGVASDITAELNIFIISLERLQSDYLDALLSEERFGAVGIVEAMAVDLESIRADLKTAVAESAASISDQIERAQEKLKQLIG